MKNLTETAIEALEITDKISYQEQEIKGQNIHFTLFKNNWVLNYNGYPFGNFYYHQLQNLINLLK